MCELWREELKSLGRPREISGLHGLFWRPSFGDSVLWWLGLPADKMRTVKVLRKESEKPSDFTSVWLRKLILWCFLKEKNENYYLLFISSIKTLTRVPSNLKNTRLLTDNWATYKLLPGDLAFFKTGVEALNININNLKAIEDVLELALQNMSSISTSPLWYTGVTGTSLINKIQVNWLNLLRTILLLNKTLSPSWTLR